MQAEEQWRAKEMLRTTEEFIYYVEIIRGSKRKNKQMQQKQLLCMAFVDLNKIW